MRPGQPPLSLVGTTVESLAEDFPLQSEVVDPPAGNLQEGLIATAALLVDRPGDEGLAGPLLADDQDRGAGRGDGRRELDGLTERRVLAEDRGAEADRGPGPVPLLPGR